MDVVTYALLKGKISAVAQSVEEIETEVSGIADGFTYKGSVATVNDLPVGADAGDMYTVTASGNAKYVYNGTAWVMVDTITTEQIDAFYT